jgi:hypothetical protein
LRQTDDQRLQLLVSDGTPQGLALLGAIKLLGDERAVPGEDRVGLDDARYLRQGFPSQPLANLRQRLPLPIAQLDAAFDLLAQYPVFCHQIFIAQQQFMIDGSREVRQQCLPIHTPCPLRLCCPQWPSSMPEGVDSMQAEARTMAKS